MITASSLSTISGSISSKSIVLSVQAIHFWVSEKDDIIMKTGWNIHIRKEINTTRLPTLKVPFMKKYPPMSQILISAIKCKRPYASVDEHSGNYTIKRFPPEEVRVYPEILLNGILPAETFNHLDTAEAFRKTGVYYASLFPQRPVKGTHDIKKEICDQAH